MKSQVIEKIFNMIGEYGGKYGRDYDFSVEGGSDDTIFVTDHKVKKTYCISVCECPKYEGEN